MFGVCLEINKQSENMHRKEVKRTSKIIFLFLSSPSFAGGKVYEVVKQELGLFAYLPGSNKNLKNDIQLTALGKR